jgi:hypothetical protein
LVQSVGLGPTQVTQVGSQIGKGGEQVLVVVNFVPVGHVKQSLLSPPSQVKHVGSHGRHSPFCK